ncbi:class I lanthipeptide [Kordia sp.]|uniref:class I lanthipeptide n=1 Tax=Kordia sp. TaxID=1965332 RepID=UPI0025C68079|nr:class I lanthipeptide [Kordia sp.]MCH2195901.1 class I lanthipeptide [Kordia sp.]
MKKKQFNTKLLFQKTTIVSFNAMKKIHGGQLVNVDTVPISVDGLTCLTLQDCQTQTKDNQHTCFITCNDCPRPTRTDTVNSNGCTGDVTRVGCFETRDVC